MSVLFGGRYEKQEREYNFNDYSVEGLTWCCPMTLRRVTSIPLMIYVTLSVVDE